MSLLLSKSSAITEFKNKPEGVRQAFWGLIPKTGEMAALSALQACATEPRASHAPGALLPAPSRPHPFEVFALNPPTPEPDPASPPSRHRCRSASHRDGYPLHTRQRGSPHPPVRFSRRVLFLTPIEICFTLVYVQAAARAPPLPPWTSLRQRRMPQGQRVWPRPAPCTWGLVGWMREERRVREGRALGPFSCRGVHAAALLVSLESPSGFSAISPPGLCGCFVVY